jgi:hypothetical protein
MGHTNAYLKAMTDALDAPTFRYLDQSIQGHKTIGSGGRDCCTGRKEALV